MANTQPTHSTDTWTFHLQQDQESSTMQFHITSEQVSGQHIFIEGHDISALLDFLYEHRELIYHATHDEELSRQEKEAHILAQKPQQPFETVFYFDDGTERTIAER